MRILLEALAITVILFMFSLGLLAVLSVTLPQLTSSGAD
jgi:hypothetical protein